MTRARSRIFGQAIDRHDLRGVVRRIKAGHIVWYSPDQDFGRDVSVFAPLFGQQAATIRLTAKIARMTGAPVVPLMFHRNPDNRTYTIECLPAFEDFPCGDELADATRVNAFIERAIRKHPEQYLWLHRRFKTVLRARQVFTSRINKAHKKSCPRAAFRWLHSLLKATP
ncbi:hypothetical protein HAALTHF_22410n [Vreelandella aquamarina]|nr:hypothetical protein HAALTHF_22410n [Halomonas axialensis]